MVRFTEFLLVLLQCHFHCGISSYWHKNRFQENFSSFVNWYKMWCSPDFEITLISRLLWTSSTTSIYSVFNLIELRIVLWLFSIYKSWSQALFKDRLLKRSCRTLSFLLDGFGVLTLLSTAPSHQAPLIAD